ncbi:MAG: ATP-binding protein [Phycisphaerales bacterium]
MLHPAHTRAEIDGVEATVLAAVDRFRYPEASRFAVRLSLEEALVNAFQHGHRGLPDSTTIEVDYAVSPSDVTIRIKDQGPGFVPVAVPDPTADENLELPSGRGLMLMRAFMSSVDFDEGGTRVTLKYKRPAGE